MSQNRIFLKMQKSSVFYMISLWSSRWLKLIERAVHKTFAIIKLNCVDSPTFIDLPGKIRQQKTCIKLFLKFWCDWFIADEISLWWTIGACSISSKDFHHHRFSTSRKYLIIIIFSLLFFILSLEKKSSEIENL